jgi:hypothetical protein
MLKNFFYLLAATLISCNVQRNLPPGTAVLSENIYMDVVDIRNVDYLEYLHWTQKVHGSASEAYVRAYPDTAWLEKLTRLKGLSKDYLHSPAYRKFPVLGVSRNQAEAFCQWRSDRVFEFILVREGVIRYDAKRQEQRQFSIAKYFNGDFEGLKPDTSIKYIRYILPDSIQETRSGFRSLCSYKEWAR